MNDKLSAEDLATFKSIEEAWKDIEEGKYKKLPTSDFRKTLNNW